jgi:Bacteriophage protein of unknown function (DUF646).
MARKWSYSTYGKSALGIKFEINGFDKYMEAAEKAGKSVDSIAIAAINSTLPKIANDMIAGAKRHKKSGDVVEAIKIKEAKQDGNYIYGEVGIFPKENPEAMHAVFQEYGDGHSPGFPDPFIRPAIDSNKSTVKSTLKKALFKGEVPKAKNTPARKVVGKIGSPEDVADYRNWLKINNPKAYAAALAFDPTFGDY